MWPKPEVTILKVQFPSGNLKYCTQNIPKLKTWNHHLNEDAHQIDFVVCVCACYVFQAL